MKRGHHFPVFFIPKKLMLKGFVIVLVLMPFSNKKSTIDLQRKGVYKVLLCILKRSCPRTFGQLIDLCSFVPKHLALQYLFSNNCDTVVFGMQCFLPVRHWVAVDTFLPAPNRNLVPICADWVSKSSFFKN